MRHQFKVLVDGGECIAVERCERHIVESDHGQQVGMAMANSLVATSMTPSAIMSLAQKMASG